MSPQRLIVFGASGNTGRHIVHQALDAGHHVTAFVRNPDKLGLTHDRLRLHVGDVTRSAQVDSAVAGHDAVLCALGAPPTSTARLRERGTLNILNAMENHGVERFIAQSVYGIGNTRGALPRYLTWLVVPFWLEKAFADHAAQEQHVRDSNAAWTLVRPPFLDNGPQTGTYRHGIMPSDDPIRMKVSRADVAAFMLRQLDDDTYLKASPWLSQ